MARGENKSSGTRWKHSEDMIIVETLTEFVSKGMNIQEAFPILPNRIPGRTEAACSARWYAYLEDIYGDALEIAKQKQQENAQKVVQAILNNQGELEVIHENKSKMELVMPSSLDLLIDLQKQKIPSAMPNQITDIHTAIAFLLDMGNNYADIKKENDQLLEELEITLNENEKMKMEIISLKGERERFNTLKELANKIESVKL